MPRELTSHRTNALNRAIQIHAYDDGTKYSMQVVDGSDQDTVLINYLKFQSGPAVEPAGFNGFTIEALLAIVEDKLTQFQQGSFSSQENAQALIHLKECMMWLGKRTRDREQRGVDGTLVK